MKLIFFYLKINNENNSGYFYKIEIQSMLEGVLSLLIVPTSVMPPLELKVNTLHRFPALFGTLNVEVVLL